LSAIDEIQAVVFRWKNMYGSTIKPTLHRRANGPNYWYRLQLVEDFGSVDDAGNHMPSRKLDECVKWVEDKLKDHPECNRMSWDMWDFKRRRDAEKFLTVFHLSWEQ
jgi:hypothetical protein